MIVAAALWLVCGVSAGAAGGAGGEPIVIDGRFDDWRGVAYQRVDDPNDAEGAFDVCRVGVTTRGSVLFLRFNVGRVLTLQAGPDGDGTLILDVESDAERRLSIDLRDKALWLDGDTGNRVAHGAVGLVTGPTHSAEEFELRADLSVLGLAPGDAVMVRFRGSDELDSPVRVVMDGEPVVAERGTTARALGTAMRLANLNVFHNGLVKPERSEAIGRLIRAVDADVYCIQEEWRTPEGDIGAAFDRAMGDAPGAWHAVSVDGAAVVSRWALEASPVTLARSGMAVVTTPGGVRIAVTSVHFKCCGYDGSMEDRTRIEEARTLADVLSARMESGEEAVVAGDWNLVGSALPLAVLTSRDGIALERVWPRHLDGVEAHTWRDDSKSFTPGVLDLVAHSDGLRALRSFVFDTADLDAEQLESLGVLSADSGASDHLVVVTDFAAAE